MSNENDNKLPVKIRKMYSLTHNSAAGTLKNGSKANRKERRKAERIALKAKLKAGRTEEAEQLPDGQFRHGGMLLHKPENGLEVFDACNYIIGDKAVDGLKLSGPEVEANAANGDFLLVLRRVDTTEYKFAAITITSAEILKAREQRLQLAYLVDEYTVASLIKRDLGKQVDGRLKDPKKIIEKHKEDFLAVYDIDVILRDVERMLINL